jgi:hypothetical protein
MPEPIKLFDVNQTFVLTARDIKHRRDAMEKVAGFIPENPCQRNARHALFHNINLYEYALEVVGKMRIKVPDEFNAYQEEKYKLGIECGGKTESISDGQVSVYDITDKDKFLEEAKKLDLKYKKTILDTEKILIENERLWEREIEDPPKLKKVPYSCFPDSIPARDDKN